MAKWNFLGRISGPSLQSDPALVPPANPADAPAINAIANGDFSEKSQKLGPHLHGGPCMAAGLSSQAARATNFPFQQRPENALRPAVKAMLNEGEVAAKGAGHAEVTGINAAQEMGLTPTGVAASRGICPACAEFLRELGIAALTALRP